jgi:RNA polymerase sigma-70 factor (ECF subfamily)
MEQARVGREVMPLARPSAVSERELAFGAFVERALPQHYRLARAILGDPAEAEDATHDAFELAWKRWHTLRDPDLLDAWFGRIVVNVCRDRLRRRRRHPFTDLSTDGVASIAVRDETARASDRDEIGRAMSRLNPDQQVAIVLRYYADLTVDEIAARVGAPPGTVKSRLHHAMAALHRTLAAGRDVR